MSRFRYVGTSTPPVLGEIKVTGRGRFASDGDVTGALHAAVLRSPVPHAKISLLDLNTAGSTTGVVAVITREDLGLDRLVRHCGDVIAAVAAETAEAAQAAIAAIDLEFDRLPTVTDPTRALDDEPVLFADRSSNLALELTHTVGDSGQALAEADVVLDTTYYTGRPTHCNLSPRCCIATLGADGVIEVTTSVDAPFFARRELAEALDLPVERIRVVLPTLLASSFGGRTGITRGCEPVAARLAMMTDGRPVRLHYEPMEEFVAGTTRHPVVARLVAGATRDGRLVGLDLDVVADHGPYDDFVGQIVLSACRDRPLDLYDLSHYTYRGRVALTNNLIAGEMRGIGATQVCAVLGVHMDELALRIGFDPVQFHLNNLSPRARSALPRTPESGLTACLQQGATSFGWAPQGAGADRRRASKRRGRGVGIGTHTTGLGTFHGPDRATAVVSVEGNAVTIGVAAPDSGQGNTTVLAQIAAEEVGVPIESIRFQSIDTGTAPPDQWGSVASRGTYVVGRAVRLAASQARERVIEAGSRILGAPVTDLRLDSGRIGTADGVTVSIAEALNGDRIAVTAEGVTDSTPPTFGACFAEVEIDEDTGAVHVLRIVHALDVGFAMNPAHCRGQIEGAIAMGLEFALGAEVVLSEGVPENTTLIDYRVARTTDLPWIETILVEGTEVTGPYGARGIGTPALTPVVPAIANAVRDALGVRPTTIPMTPEQLTRLVRAHRPSQPPAQSGSPVEYLLDASNRGEH